MSRTYRTKSRCKKLAAAFEVDGVSVFYFVYFGLLCAFG